ncbi:MAG TPA: hypothetical protein VK184_07505 [Nostocaceae cyanobacterium]|nr:hypothetical protein [Nostocaceae cyanobacterium]
MVQQTERKTFILSRLRSGISRLDVQRQFADKYECTVETARLWLNKTCDELTDHDIHSRKRTYAVIVEMHYAQITAYQNDLVAIQKEIDHISNIEKHREVIIEQVGFARGEQLNALLEQLKALPEPPLGCKSSLVESKSRVRERMFRVILELTKLHRLGDSEQTQWRDALAVLLDNNLMPGDVAEKILKVIEEFDQQLSLKINNG